MFNNIAILCDSYKCAMNTMYPPKTEYVYSYIESRGGEYDRTVFFGLQILLKEYLTKPVTKEMVDEAEDFWAAHGEPFNRGHWDYIVERHNGYLPLSIMAVPEGTVVPTKNVLATVVNTDPKCFWLTTWVETLMLQTIWYGTTVATNSYRCKQVIKSYLDKTCDNPEAEIAFRMHDFGFRGTSSVESAAIGGAAHLVNFMGTDTTAGILAARRYYAERMAGYSIPASEHSVICSWGREHEADAYENMITQFGKPGAIFACVSDAYDIYNATRNMWGGDLKQKLLDSGSTLVVRPDSGDPLVVPVDIVEILSEQFGFTVNAKGFKVLPKAVRCIQGDGITVNTIPLILNNLTQRGFSAENLAFGQGGGLLQMVNRDTFKFAMKCSAVCVDGVWRNVSKDPVTDPGKRSKEGRLALVHEGGQWQTVAEDGNAYRNKLEPVFRNGELLKDWSFAEVRARSNAA